MSTVVKSKCVDLWDINESQYQIQYGQYYCPVCGGQINTGFQCIKCGRQFSPPTNNSVVIKKDRRES